MWLLEWLLTHGTATLLDLNKQNRNIHVFDSFDGGLSSFAEEDTKIVPYLWIKLILSLSILNLISIFSIIKLLEKVGIILY